MFYWILLLRQFFLKTSSVNIELLIERNVDAVLVFYQSGLLTIDSEYINLAKTRLSVLTSISIILI